MLTNLRFLNFSLSDFLQWGERKDRKTSRKREVREKFNNCNMSRLGTFLREKTDTFRRFQINLSNKVLVGIVCVNIQRSFTEVSTARKYFFILQFIRIKINLIIFDILLSRQAFIFNTTTASEQQTITEETLSSM